MIRLRVFAHPDDTLIADWGCNVSPLSPGSFKFTTASFELRALLTKGSTGRLELARAWMSNSPGDRAVGRSDPDEHRHPLCAAARNSPDPTWRDSFYACDWAEPVEDHSE
jgi:hypothetical protein